MPIKLYYMTLSPPSRVVYTVAKELGIDFNIKHIDLFKDEHKTPEYKKINPMQKVPAIDDNGFILWESHVIITYFCNEYGSSKNEHLYPKDPKKRALVDRLLYFSIGTFWEGFQAYLEPKLGIWQTDAAIGEAKLHKSLEFLEAVLEKGPYLTGDNYTLADICLLVYIATLQALDFNFSAYPKLQKWICKTKSHISCFEECNAEGLQQTADYAKKAASAS